MASQHLEGRVGLVLGKSGLPREEYDQKETEEEEKKERSKRGGGNIQKLDSGDQPI